MLYSSTIITTMLIYQSNMSGHMFVKLFMSSIPPLSHLLPYVNIKLQHTDADV